MATASIAPALAWLIAEAIKLTIDRVSQMGKLETLTEADAKLMLDQIAASLSTKLPTPEELERGDAA